MKAPSQFFTRSARLTFPVVPLLSCAPLLLLFFLCTSNFASPELSLTTRLAVAAAPSALQPATPPAEDDFEPIVVRIRRPGAELAWTVQDTPVASLAELQQGLAKIARIKPDIPLLIDPAPDVPLGDAFTLFDVARLSGLTKIQFAVPISAD